MSKHLTRSLFGDIYKVRDKLSIFLDFDGTLTPIGGHPDDAYLSSSMKEVLIALSSKYPLAIISGRGIVDLNERVGLPGIVYSGNHGMEIISDGFSFIYDIGLEESEELLAVAAKLTELSNRYDSVVLEVKGLSLSIHYKQMEKVAEALFLGELKGILKPFVQCGLIKVTGGKKIAEIRAMADWHKGSAVEWIMERGLFISNKSTIPLYIGDDDTDRDAFNVIRGTGISIFVGSKEARTDYYFNREEEVEPFLSFLAGGSRQ